MIIGASLAGAKAAETLRDEGFAGRVVLIGEESELPYERPPLSKGYLLGNDPRDGGRVHDAGWYAENHVELRTGHRRRRHRHRPPADHPASGRLAALRQAAARHRVAGPDADHSRRRTWRACTTCAPWTRRTRCWRASAPAARGGRRRRLDRAGDRGGRPAPRLRVTVVEMDSLPLRRVLGDEVAAIYRDLHSRTASTSGSAPGSASSRATDGHVTGVLLADGTVLPADLVVVGVGIRPAVELAESAGLRVDNGIVADARAADLRRHIWACGRRRVLVPSAAEHPDPGRALGERAERRPGRRPVDARPSRITRRCRTSSPTSTTWAWSTRGG